MGKRFEVIQLDDVYPLADEYGNEFAQRDYSLKVNQDYVAELAESMRRTGEPDEPITVIPEGGIYYVRTGRSRYEAMKLLGTRECHAVIDEDTSRKAAIEAIIHTDVKKKYESVEKSRIVQQLQMFGDDQYVSEEAGITVEQSRKLRRAREAVDDAGDDMTLERMYVIAEFADDEKKVELLSTCSESEVGYYARKFRSEREAEKAKAALVAAFAKLGIEAANDRSHASGMNYYAKAADPDKAEDALPPDWEPGQVAVVIVQNYTGVSAEVYVDHDLAADDETEEEAEARRMAEAYGEALAAMDESLDEWFWGNLAAGKPMPNVMRELEQVFRDLWYVKQAVHNMTEDAEAAAKNKGLSAYDYAIAYEGYASSGGILARALATGKLESYRRGQAASYLDELVMFQADGWEPGDAHALIAKISEIVDGEEDKDDE